MNYEAMHHEGRAISVQYCSTCHLFPEPEILPKEVWTSSVLPAMGPKMGIFRHEVSPYPTERDSHLPENYYPRESQLSRSEWQQIINYYSETAPEELTPSERDPAIQVDSLFFNAIVTDYLPDSPPKVSAVRFDSVNRLIYTADINERSLLVFDEKLSLVNKLPIGYPISDIRLQHDSENTGLMITLMGQLLPTDATSGSVRKISYDPDENEVHSDILIWDEISRPVESKIADLNQNGLKDLLISEFGHRAGSLFWLENTGNEFEYEKHVLIDTPGCINSEIGDFTGNGLKDIAALCTQEDQAIYLFKNEGEGNFQRETLLQFHIAAGSSSFQLHDFNNNGFPDILYTSGDNADYSTVFKPYHGVYIFLNDGNNNFEEEWFYPVHGAFNAQAADFTQNGEPDIAVIGFYADFENKPEEGFAFFKNEGGLNFTPYHHPEASKGRWITMDVADWTGNGFDDILLGNFSDGFFGAADSTQEVWRNSPQFLLLENKPGR
ncbi:MAG: VCBS repeat-containing protein [Balneolaceae bacterium]|nr:VCBS repeat-containing protein [Balneolaceae bacterium]